MAKIDFDNGLTGDELRRYRIRSDSRQYFLTPLIPDYVIEEDIINGGEIRTQKVEKGELLYKEINDKASCKTMQHVLDKYLEREAFDNNARSFEQLAKIYEAAAKRRAELEDEFALSVTL